MKWTRPLCGPASMSQNDFKTSETIQPQEARPMKHIATYPHIPTFYNGSCWIPGSWDLPMSYNPIVVTLSSLNPFFFNGLKKELGFSNNAWSIRPRNPIRASQL
jgi:hypothetical protein